MNETAVANDCLFCQIASKKVPSILVNETEKTLAFLDIKPASGGHVIVIPKAHFQILPQIDDNTIIELFDHAQKISHAILSGLSDRGVNGTSIIINQGQVAGQKASHFMIHIIPRIEGESFLIWDSMKEDEKAVYELASILRDKITNGTQTNRESDKNIVKEVKKNEESLDLDEISKALGS